MAYPDNPFIGQTEEIGGTTKQWNGYAWVNITNGNKELRIRRLEGQVFDVRNYGAVGDGVTDDRAAIQAAIDASNGATVFFPYTGNPYLIGSTHPDYPTVGLVPTHHNTRFESNHGADNSQWTLKAGVDMASVITPASRKDGLHFVNFSVDCDNKADYGVHLANDYYPYTFWENVTITRAKVMNADINTFTSEFKKCKFSRSVDGWRVSGLGTGVATSVTVTSCYALNNTNRGHVYKNFIYSSLIACASDTNKVAYEFDTAYAVSMTGCGAEGCEKQIVVDGYRGFNINTFYVAVGGKEIGSEPYLIEFQNGTDATVGGLFLQEMRNYDYKLAVTGSNFGSENVTVLDYSIKRNEVYSVSNFTFERPIKFLRDDETTKNETVTLDADELFDYLATLQGKHINHTLTIQVNDGIQPDENTPSLVKLRGSGTIVIQGNVGDRTAVELRAGGDEPWFVDGCSCLVVFKNLRIRNRTNGNTSDMFIADNARKVILDNVELYNSVIGRYGVRATDGSTIHLINDTRTEPSFGVFTDAYLADATSSIILGSRAAPPTTGHWEVGQRFDVTAPTAGGAVTYVCTASGWGGTWKSINLEA